MRVLLATPYLAPHLDSGLFWVKALADLGHQIIPWDYRTSARPPAIEYDVAIGLKTPGELAKFMHSPKAVYWPDEFERTPGELQNLLREYDLVATPVRPTPSGCMWLLTGWDEEFHLPNYAVGPEGKDIPSLFIGTYTEHKAGYLEVIRPSIVLGNDYPRGFPNYRDHTAYGREYVMILGHAQVLINLHRDAGIGLNRRMFEMIACGFTVFDDVPGVADVFGETLLQHVSFDSPEEGRDMVQHYLAHPQSRDTLWQQERAKILPYTYQKSCQKLLEALTK